jgi:uncharacterized protein
MPSRDPPVRPSAVVTGASGGIGLALARLLARDGYRVVLAARNAARLAAVSAELEAAYGVPSIAIPVDLSRPEGVARLGDVLHSSAIEPDVLVNNAGFGGAGAFVDTDLEVELQMIQLNIAAVTQLTKRILPGMVSRGRGRVLNVASTAAFQPGPYMAVYYASKAYVLSFSQAIAEEVVGTGVTVTALCPGPTHTGFAERAGLRGFEGARRGVAMSADAVAERGYAGMVRGERVVVPGSANRILAQAVRVAPRRLVTMLAARLNRDRGIR